MRDPEHELHGRRRGRNMSVGAILGGIVLLVFGVTVVKLSTGGTVEGFDHSYRQGLVPDK